MVNYAIAILLMLSIQIHGFQVAIDSARVQPGERFHVAILVDTDTPSVFYVQPVNAVWYPQCTNPAIVRECTQASDGDPIRVTLREPVQQGAFLMPFRVAPNVHCTKAGVIAYDHPALLDVTGCQIQLPIIIVM